MSPQRDVTRLLQLLADKDLGDRKAIYDRLIDLIYNDLRDLARRQFGHQWNPITLQPTALVHEAYQRLIHYEMNFENRAHFMSVAATAMRRLCWSSRPGTRKPANAGVIRSARRSTIKT
jgi:DNA-directed RNA polymerase specialized sigma24 family protein